MNLYERLKQRDYAASSTFQHPSKGNANSKQIETYLTICKEKFLQPINYESLSFDEMSKELTRVISLRSQQQINLIHEKIAIIQGYGMNLDTFLSSSPLDELTKGREGTASKLIQELFAIEKECNILLPPTDKQLDIIQDWILCPDIPFEEFSIQRTQVLNVEEGTTLWRRLTTPEFRNKISICMKRNEASKFIDDYRGVFHDWRKTRISKGKRDSFPFTSPKRTSSTSI